MSRSLMADAFAHHVWATLRLIDTCQALTPEQLSTGVPGTYGSILDTLGHLVGADRWYLVTLTGGWVEGVDDDGMDLAQLRDAMALHAPAWSSVLDGDPDPDAILVRRRDDGSEIHAPVGVRLAQALHHGTDHRSQVCTALTALGVKPPDIDVWDHAFTDGRLVEVEATS
jgi:uncharacterized damage-inducible protein DinB